MTGIGKQDMKLQETEDRLEVVGVVARPHRITQMQVKKGEGSVCLLSKYVISCF